MNNQLLKPSPMIMKSSLVQIAMVILVLLGGCSVAPEQLKITELDTAFPSGTIIETASGQPISMAQLMQHLEQVQIIYVGESHPDPNHHLIQRDLIEALQAETPDLVVGMEMFATPYQATLDRWSADQLAEPHFLELTHWYANWRYDFALYRPILTSIKDHNLTLIGLNLPFHIPPKISTGGLASLLPEDARYLPKQIDLTDPAHREYVETVYGHHRIKGRDNFNYFYEAQCAWEDTMAETIARLPGNRRMVVIIGNGHIVHKFGVPDRVFARTDAPFRTIYLARVGKEVNLNVADYIWVTPPRPHRTR